MTVPGRGSLFSFAGLISISFSSVPAGASSQYDTALEWGNVAYFLAADQKRIFRHDLEKAEPLAPLVFEDAPTALGVDDQGLYVAFDRRVSHFNLSTMAETHLRNSTTTIYNLATQGDFLHVFAQDGVISAQKLTGEFIDRKSYFYFLAGISSAPGISKFFGVSVGISPADIFRIEVTPDGMLGEEQGQPLPRQLPDRGSHESVPRGGPRRDRGRDRLQHGRPELQQPPGRPVR